ncbi:hypothetical protein [Rhodococcus sp. JS3073]|uniref:hypothetical protein n=1 Tax=Rhodococcus sp. JS3073 TaxID=3002901 RepID=UPI002285DE55|nr:hypothetical protein [Rhodococcus sp. JS3073]WAM20048.1 hypothetical protein OYT95_44190 [Rhodococcus sp. JS3073]
MFTVTRGDRTAVFDSFECAAQAMAPQCGTAGYRILGHGVEADKQMYCCAHCAHESGHTDLADRTGG